MPGPKMTWIGQVPKDIGEGQNALTIVDEIPDEKTSGRNYVTRQLTMDPVTLRVHHSQLHSLENSGYLVSGHLNDGQIKERRKVADVNTKKAEAEAKNAKVVHAIQVLESAEESGIEAAVKFLESKNFDIKPPKK